RRAAPSPCSRRLGAPTSSPISPLSLHDALPISVQQLQVQAELLGILPGGGKIADVHPLVLDPQHIGHIAPLQGFAQVGLHAYPRSEEHTSELQSRENLVCRLLLAKKKSHSPPAS